MKRRYTCKYVVCDTLTKKRDEYTYRIDTHLYINDEE